MGWREGGIKRVSYENKATDRRPAVCRRRVFARTIVRDQTGEKQKLKEILVVAADERDGARRRFLRLLVSQKRDLISLLNPCRRHRRPSPTHPLTDPLPVPYRLPHTRMAGGGGIPGNHDL